MKLNLKIISLIIFLGFLGYGLQNSPAAKPNLDEYQPEKDLVLNISLAEDIKKNIMAVEGPTDATSVVLGKNIYTAIKVTGLQRWNLKKIKNEIYKKLKNENSDYTIHVTADKKLFYQLQQIENKVNQQNENINLKDIDKKLKIIDAQM